MRRIYRRLLVAALMAMMLTPTTVEARPTTNTNKTAGQECSSVKYHNYLTRSWLRYSHHGADYHASTPTRQQLEDLASIRACLKRTDREKYKLVRGAWEKRKEQWAFYHYIDVITPYGAWATKPYIVDRESRYDKCAANPSSSAGGYYQMIDSTWYSALRAIGYHGQTKFGRYPGDWHVAACAPDWLQHEAAHYLWANGHGEYTHWRATA